MAELPVSGEMEQPDLEHMEHGEEMLTWNDFTVPQLQEELTVRGLDTSGEKAELIVRLEKYDEDINAQQMKPEDVEGDEFVVWNADDEADQDAEFHGSNGKKEEDEEMASAESAIKKQEESKGVDEDKAPKEPDVDFSIYPSKDRDLLYLMWTGSKIPIPFRDEVQKDLKHVTKLLNVMMYPVCVDDLFSDAIRPFIASAVNVSTELDETVPGQPLKGYLRLKFGSVGEAANAMEVLKEYRHDGRELTLKHFADDDSEGHILSKIKKEDAERRGGPLPMRLLYVGNLAPDVTEEALRQIFTDAIRIYLPCKEDSAEKLGYAYLEYATEADTIEAAKKHRDTELGDRKLYVIRSMTDRVMGFGLLKDSLRKYWLEQIHTLEESKSASKSPKELEAIEVKLNRMKRRIKKDNAKRETLCLPVLESEIVEAPDSEDEKEAGAKDDRSKDDKREKHSAHRDRKSSERRRTPPRRPRFSPSRGSRPFRGGFRGASRGGAYRGGPSSYGGGRDADRLVDQLQELVGALAHRERGSERDYGGGYSGRAGGGYYEPLPPRRAPPTGYGSSSGYRGDYSSPGARYVPKRPADHMDYGGGDRKRHADDRMDYGGRSYGGGRGGYDGGYSRRGGPSYY